ncbi:MAG: hypothetical protein J5974_02035, partial [Pyramidobacter sp.]|nr:hypothetical protein [Pyramidobacter sp.]
RPMQQRGRKRQGRHGRRAAGAFVFYGVLHAVLLQVSACAQRLRRRSARDRAVVLFMQKKKAISRNLLRHICSILAQLRLSKPVLAILPRSANCPAVAQQIICF